jgi:DNA replication protein DnaC
MRLAKVSQGSIFYDYILDRVKNKNKNFVMVLVGPTGSGKSYSALRIGEGLDPKFNIDSVCFKAVHFMSKVNELIERSKKGEDLKGRVLLWDEFGVEHNSREFMSLTNRVINYFFQTSRHLNLIVLLSVPVLSFIDSATRKLIHCTAEMRGIDRTRNLGNLSIKMLQTNSMTGKEYPKRFRYKLNNQMHYMESLQVPLPSKDLIDTYELAKSKFTSNLNKEIMDKLLADEEKQKEKRQRFKPLTERQEQIKELMKNNNVEGVAKILEINKGTVYEQKKAIEGKGFSFIPIREDNRVTGHKIEDFREKAP